MYRNILSKEGHMPWPKKKKKRKLKLSCLVGIYYCMLTRHQEFIIASV